MRYICTAVVATLALVGTSFAATINVPGDHVTIQDAINSSADGDVIAIAAGTYYEANLNTWGMAITIGSASGNQDVTIDGQQAGSVFVIESGEGDGTVIENLVITGGNGTDLGVGTAGGGIYCYNSSPTITDCTISNNTDTRSGGGIYCDYSNPAISNCTISNNTGDYGGGIACRNSNPTISGCTITDNSGMAADGGGGIYCYNSSPTISDSQICGNTPNQIHGSYTDGGGNTVVDECDTALHVPSEYATIQGAIDASSNGDFIAIAAGTYYEANLNPNGKAITIGSASGNLDVTIDAAQAGSVFVIESGEGDGTVIENLVITGGSANSGGGIRCSGSPTITNCTISNNQASSNSGGGIFITGNPIITDCTISDNSANWGGGVYVQNPGNPTLSGCTVSGNTAPNGAGGIFIASGGQLTLSDSSVCGNNPDQINGSYTDGGGNTVVGECDTALHVPSDYPTIQDAINTSADGDVIAIAAGTYNEHSLNPNGKAITIGSASGNLDVTIDAQQGGSVFVINSGEGHDTVIKDLVITGGSTNYYGGGISCGQNSSPTIRGCTIETNTAHYGGGISCYSSNPTIADCTITGNTAYVGGGIYCTGSNITLTDCTITGNIAAGEGGGIYNVFAGVNATDCTFVGNSAMSMDVATNLGGAVCTLAGGSSQFTTCDFEDNSAGYGGAFYTETEGSTILDACTVKRNIGKVCGGASFNLYGSVYSANTLYCGNLPDHLVGGWVNQGGNELTAVCAPDEPGVCVGDTNDDYNVDILDLLYILAVWGTDNPAGDINDDGWVNVDDMLELLGNWGAICE